MEFSLNLHRDRVRASERAPRNSQRILERLHALAKIVERGTDVHVERLGVLENVRGPAGDEPDSALSDERAW